MLADEFRIQVQQTYGLDPNSGEVTALERLSHLSDRERHTAQLLRDSLEDFVRNKICFGTDIDLLVLRAVEIDSHFENHPDAGPLSLAAYRNGLLYDHGGASLQECVVKE